MLNFSTLVSSVRRRLDGYPDNGDAAVQVATLGYHDVTDDPFDSGFQRPLAYSYKHTRRAFAEHLRAIGGTGLTPTLVTTIDFASRAEHLLLTFDDGGKSALYVSDALARCGWRAHFLITTGLIGTRTFLDKRDIVTLRRAGHVVGSHSHTHPDIFCRQPLGAMVQQWRTSRDILEQLLGEPCQLASVPGGDISDQVLESAAASGIRFLFTSEPWLTPRRVGECWLLGRVSVKKSTSLGRVRDWSSRRGWGMAMLDRRCSVLARTAFPTAYSMYVRHRTRSRDRHIASGESWPSPLSQDPRPTGSSPSGNGCRQPIRPSH